MIWYKKNTNFILVSLTTQVTKKKSHPLPYLIGWPNKKSKLKVME
jgi:hypothetical protein